MRLLPGLRWKFDEGYCAGCGRFPNTGEVFWPVPYLKQRRGAAVCESCRSREIVDATERCVMPIYNGRQRCNEPIHEKAQPYGPFCYRHANEVLDNATMLARLLDRPIERIYP